MKWHVIEAKMIIARQGGRVLGIMTNRLNENASWTVVAIETSSKAFASGTPDGVFDDHAYDAVGVFPTTGEMETAVKSYLHGWKRKKRTAKCSCRSIGEVT